MTFARVVEPELLDTLPADDPRAIRSRRDLQRINRLMATSSLLAGALDGLLAKSSAPVTLVELGAGDGTQLLRLAKRRARRWPKVRLVLLDLQPVVSTETVSAYRALGWDPEVIRADVFDWLAHPSAKTTSEVDNPIVIANLFLHHFDGLRLQALLHGIAARAEAFVALEPRRSAVALLGSRLLGAIGCNDVTRHDAVVSVRAGFRDQDMGAHWPDTDAWNIEEGRAGLFSHRFVASRKARGKPA